MKIVLIFRKMGSVARGCFAQKYRIPKEGFDASRFCESEEFVQNTQKFGIQFSGNEILQY